MEQTHSIVDNTRKDMEEGKYYSAPFAGIYLGLENLTYVQAQDTSAADILRGTHFGLECQICYNEIKRETILANTYSDRSAST